MSEWCGCGVSGVGGCGVSEWCGGGVSGVGWSVGLPVKV